MAISSDIRIRIQYISRSHPSGTLADDTPPLRELKIKIIPAIRAISPRVRSRPVCRNDDRRCAAYPELRSTPVYIHRQCCDCLPCAGLKKSKLQVTLHDQVRPILIRLMDRGIEHEQRELVRTISSHRFHADRRGFDALRSGVW